MHISSVLLVCIVSVPVAVERYHGHSSDAQEAHSPERKSPCQQGGYPQLSSSGASLQGQIQGVEG